MRIMIHKEIKRITMVTQQAVSELGQTEGPDVHPRALVIRVQGWPPFWASSWI